MAVAACLLGYGEVGLWLKKEAQKPNSWVMWEGNPYREWIEEYAGEEYQAGLVSGLSEYALPSALSLHDLSNFFLSFLVELMELLAEQDSPSTPRYDVWFSIWERTVRFEKAFWDTALNLS